MTSRLASYTFGHRLASPYTCSAIDRSVSPGSTVYSSTSPVGDGELAIDDGLAGAAITIVGRTATLLWARRLLPRRATPAPRLQPRTMIPSTTSHGQRRRLGRGPAGGGGGPAGGDSATWPASNAVTPDFNQLLSST